jgi:hypothetical protein
MLHNDILHLYDAKVYSLGLWGIPLYNPKPLVVVAKQMKKVISARGTGPVRCTTKSGPCGLTLGPDLKILLVNWHWIGPLHHRTGCHIS